ncbi:MAG: hypothetical protein JWQ76_434 [Ramlibacter sp.]|nr:hypothetical protein [Ramlibacter sp.]
MASAQHQATLQAELRTRDAGAATLAYTVRNAGASEIFLFNRMYAGVDAAGRYLLDPDLCLIELRDGAAVVAMKIPELPPRTFVEVRNVPCVTVVAAGGTFSQSIELRVPLLPWTPYAPSPGRANAVTLPVLFELGFFVGVEGTRALAKMVPTSAGDALRFAPFPIDSQLLLRTGPLGNLPVFKG